MNKKTNCNILVSGLYFSGSGAVTDLLKEYRGIGIIPGEFDDFRRAGMIGDHIQGRIARDYKCNVENVKYNSLKWSRLCCKNKFNIKKIFKYFFIRSPLGKISGGGKYRIISKRISLLESVKSDVESSSCSDDKIKIGFEWVKKIKQLYVTGSDRAVFDQPIFLNAHKDIWPKVFDPFKLIIVYRDPKDQIAQLVKLNLIYFNMETPTRGLIEAYGDDRLAAIRYELDMLKAKFRCAKKLQEVHGDDKVKLISFENLVNNYEKEKEDLERFLEISPSDHMNKKQFFDPDVSFDNIGLYKKYLTEEELSVFEDVEL